MNNNNPIMPMELAFYSSNMCSGYRHSNLWNQNFLPTFSYNAVF